MAYKTGWLKKVINGVSTKIFSFAHVKTVYTDYENGKLLSDKLTEMDDDIAEINSNLVQLEYDDVAGGSNLFDVNKMSLIQVLGNGIKRYGHIIEITESGKYCIYYKSDSVTMAYNYITNEIYGNPVAITSETKKTLDLTSGQKLVVWQGEGNTPSAFELVYVGKDTTDYEPYIPSVKMLAEEVDNINESLSVIGKCKNLLNPTLQTTTQNGIICTNNGDGTYTLNGTKTADVAWLQLGTVSLKANKSYKLIGQSPADTSTDVRVYDNDGIYFGNGTYGGATPIITPTTDLTLSMQIRIAESTLNNFTIKPMLTPNLNATYDDFVPYTGDGETLTHDVAVLKNDLMFKNVWSGEIYKANETATISNFSNSKKYLFEFKAKSIAYKQNVIVLGNQVYIEVPLIAHASTIAFTLYRLNISSNGVVTISDVINEDSGASLVNIYEI